VATGQIKAKNVGVSLGSIHTSAGRATPAHNQNASNKKKPSAKSSEGRRVCQAQEIEEGLLPGIANGGSGSGTIRSYPD